MLPKGGGAGWDRDRDTALKAPRQRQALGTVLCLLPTPQPSGCAPSVPRLPVDSGAGALLDILADLPLQALPPLLQLLNGALLRELVRGAAELALSQGAAEQLLGEEGRVSVPGTLPPGPPSRSLGMG